MKRENYHKRAEERERELMKPNWKRKYEEEAGKLKLCRDGNVILQNENASLQWERNTLKFDLANRPTIDRVVEKEVLPSWFCIPNAIVFLFYLLTISFAFRWILKLKKPILSPYPVYITKFKHDPDLNTKVIVCQEAWREDEREIRKFRKEVHENN